ncbi:MAG: L-threonylcarbamoyladenylate synthase [Rhodobacter sp.]|nr:L-threonylcarbamoyladenylate synthase [Rhodobacter sp.]
MDESLTEILAIDDAGLARAAAILQNGGLVAFPTETVYGLGADATSGAAVARVFEAKRRPAFNPLIVHLRDLSHARRLVRFDPVSERLAESFWPGALTLVLPKLGGADIDPLATAGLDSIAVRVPDHPVALRLLAKTGRPIAAPSANPSGKVSPTTAGHVAAGLSGRIDAILDGGHCAIGLESTIVAPGPVLLRPGGLTVEEMEARIGARLSVRDDPDMPNAPGQLASHYSPGVPLRLNASCRRSGEVLVGFGPVTNADLSLSPSGNLVEAAANLFRCLQALDTRGRAAAVSPIPETGLGRAINDRLRRAAAPLT